ncbi:MAG: hypothetical protein ACOYW7_14580 [Nitrospirota bacterium]
MRIEKAPWSAPSLNYPERAVTVSDAIALRLDCAGITHRVYYL